MRRPSRRHRTAACVGILFAIGLGSPMRAQDYPNRPVRIVVPFPPGGTADALPRIIGDWLARKWGQAVIIADLFDSAA